MRDVREGGELLRYGSNLILVFVFFVEVPLNFREQQFFAFVAKTIKQRSLAHFSLAVVIFFPKPQIVFGHVHVDRVTYGYIVVDLGVPCGFCFGLGSRDAAGKSDWWTVVKHFAFRWLV